MALKRTGIKPGTKRLQRHTPLQRGDSQLARTPLRRTSRKRDQENRQRTAMKKALFPLGTLCAIPDCWAPYDDVHEPLTRARGGSITDPDNSVPLCRPMHDDLGKEPVWAYEYALLVHSWEKTPPEVLAQVRRSLLAGEVPVIDIAYCAWCRVWLPSDHACPYGSPSDLDHP
ncbi:hypothetical protein [Streptosporangium canum]|uniref:hypothetical protein n=1 Tax=Streptosporangium canum TaxID=324952 RepID=UPI0037B06D79